ncbi:MAG: helix-turn-helix transcriptional regulator [Candidatus Binataceae bacterium]
MASVRAVEAPAEDELLDVEQAAALMGVSASWLYHRPKLPFRRQIGGKVKFSRAGIERYIRNRQSAMA